MSSPDPIAVLPFLSIEAVKSLARSLAQRLKPGDVVTLQGELGAGKTTFAQALVRTLTGEETEVTSPTFALMQPYDVTLAGGGKEVLWHLDLYRIEDAGELAALGLEELWPHIVLIEWPQVAAGLLPQARLGVSFAFATAQEARSLTFDGNDAWRERLSGLI